MRVETDFPLGDDRFFVVMDELNRIFHADNVPRMHGVPVIDHRRE